MSLRTNLRTPARTLLTGAGLLSLAGVAALALLPARGLDAQGATTIQVDVGADRHPIDPRVYGVSFAEPAQLAALNVPLNRWGGNSTTRHNWKQNGDNRGSDWYFESIPGTGAAGAAFDDFVSKAKANGAEPMVTIPLIGWVGKNGPNGTKLASFSAAKYGAQQDCDWSWFPDACNGVLANGTKVTGNDPNDASTPSTAAYQKEWAQHLVSRWGLAASGGVRYYLYDNEPSLWHSTHRDVHPTGARMTELRDLMVAYGTAIRQADPGAVLVGPEEWGWTGYFWSGYDQQYNADHGCWSCSPDKTANGGTDYLPWLLAQLRASEQATGTKLLNVFTVHYYPQGGEYWGGTSTSEQALRNRSTRSLWDPSYTDESWIADKVQLVPRMKQWVATYYPGLETGITEYNWGAEDHINGATAQADVLGIFGREGLNLATRWTTPSASSVSFKAIQMYRNYDGQKSAFGDVNVRAAGPNPDSLAVFAAQRSVDGAVTVMAINKVGTGALVDLRLANFTAGAAAQVWQLTSANAIARLGDVTVSGGALTTTLAPQSITLFVVPRGGATQPSLSVGDVALDEGASGMQSATFTVSLSTAASQAVTVGYATANATATAGSDYTATSGTLTFAAGQTSKTVAVPVSGDAAIEADETFTLGLSGASGATIARATGIGTIRNDDFPALSINDVSVAEGNSGTTNAILTVTMSAAAPFTVGVNYTTADGTATAGSDYAASAGSLTFAAGQTIRTIAVPVAGDTTAEPNETLFVNLAGATGAVVSRAQGQVTLVNDDPLAYYVSPVGDDANACSQAAPCRQVRRALKLVHAGDTILVADGSYLGFDVAGIAGTAALPVTIRAQGSAAQVTATTDRSDNRDTIFVTGSSYVVLDGLRAANANRAAVRVDQSPHVTVRNGVFGNNASWGIFTDFSDDLLLENNECYGSRAEHGIYVSNSGDRPIVRGNRLHDNAGAGVQLNADVSQGGDGIISGALIENNVIYNNGAAGGAAINLDGVQDSVVRNNLLYGNHATGIVNYQGDGASGPKGMDISNNTVDQASDGRYALLLAGTVGANRVRNNVLYHPNVARGSITYGNATDVANVDSDYNVVTRVTPDDGSTLYTLAQWQALGHEAHSITSTPAVLFVSASVADYHLAAGSPAIDRGQALTSVPQDIEGRTRPLGGGWDLGAYESTGAASLPTLSIGDVAVAEGNSGTSAATFTVTLSAASTSTVTVAYATANGTATAGSDYVAQSGTLTFTAGQTSKTIAVVVNGDTTVEPSETFTVTLSGASGATIARATATGTITNDDTAALPTLSIGDVAVAEGNSGTSAATFTVTLSAASTSTVTVAYATANGTATAGSDYVAQSGTLTFAAGQTSKTIAVVVNGDTTVEPSETFTVTLSGASGATIARATATGTITNDDSATLPSLSINDVTVVEGNAGTRLATFTVTLSGVSASAVSVAYATANGSARAGSDYLAQSGTLTFAAGQTTRTIGVVVKGDRNVEPNETLSVRLSGAVGATIARAAGTGTIANDDFRGRAVRQGWW